jgi:hypothetical protein
VLALGRPGLRRRTLVLAGPDLQLRAKP